MGYSILVLQAKPVACSNALMSSLYVSFCLFFAASIFHQAHHLGTSYSFFGFMNELSLILIRSFRFRPLMWSWKIKTTSYYSSYFLLFLFHWWLLNFCLWTIRDKSWSLLVWQDMVAIIESFGWRWQRLQKRNLTSREVSSHRKNQREFGMGTLREKITGVDSVGVAVVYWPIGIKNLPRWSLGPDPWQWANINAGDWYFCSGENKMVLVRPNIN